MPSEMTRHDDDLEAIIAMYERRWASFEQTPDSAPELAELLRHWQGPLGEETQKELVSIDAEKRLKHGLACTPGTYAELNISAVEVERIVEEQKRHYQENLIADRFVLLGEFGQGAFGCVYRAVDRNPTSLHPREVALKIAWPVVGALVPDNFLAEAKAAVKLSHPNIIQLYDSGKDRLGRPWLSLQPIRGGMTLADSPLAAAKQNGATWRERRDRSAAIAVLLHAVASAIEHAHDAQIVHGDLTPHNILIDDVDRPRVADFGLARSTGARDQSAEHSTQNATTDEADDSIALTLQFIAPECRQGQIATSCSDIYSIGAIGKWLLKGSAGQSQRGAIATTSAAMPHTGKNLPGWTPKLLDKICDKATHTTPDERYQSALELREDLERVVNGTEPLVLTWWRRTWYQTRRNKAGIGLFVVAVLIAVGVGVGFWWHLEQKAESAHRSEIASLLSQGTKRVELHDREGAERLFNKALEADPPADLAAEAHYRLANSLRSQAKTREDRAQAVEHYRQAIRLNPRHLESRLNLANTYDENKDYVQAVSVLRELIEVAPEYAPAYNNLANELDALATSQPGEKERLGEESMAYRLKAIEIDPDYFDGHLNLGKTLARQEKYDQALGHFERAIQINEKNSDAWSSLGNTRRKLMRQERDVARRQLQNLSEDAFQSAVRWAEAEFADGAARPIFLSALLGVLSADERLERLGTAARLRWFDPDFLFEISESACELVSEYERHAEGTSSDKARQSAAQTSSRLQALAVQQLRAAIKFLQKNAPERVSEFKRRIGANNYMRVLSDRADFKALLE